MAVTWNRGVVKMMLAVVVGMSMGACSSTMTTLKQYNVKKDSPQWIKNVGDYLNLRNGLLDPSQVGRFDKAKPWGWSKPVTWPILDKLDMIDEPNEHWTMATDPLPSDLVVEQKEYVLGEGDVINVSVFELVTPGLPYQDQKVVNEVGKVTLQNLGQVDVSGLTATQLEQRIGQLAVDMQLLRAKGQGSPGPQVSVQLVQSRARVFSALGAVGASGTYNIIGTDFRLLDALALVHDIAGGNQPGMDYLYVIRAPKNAGVYRTPTSQPTTATSPADPLNAIDRATTRPSAQVPTSPATPVGDGPILLYPLPRMITADVPPASGLDAAISGGTPLPLIAQATPALPATPAGTGAVPATTDPGSAIPGGAPNMIHVNGHWEPTAGGTTTMTPEQMQASASSVGLPRIIRIPIVALKEGDRRYNIIIQPGDIINVPNIEPGEFYLMGHVGRPGVYSLTGRKVTLKQAVAAAGGLDSVAIPRRCDLIRRIGEHTEVTIQVDLQRVFDGEQPDFFLKANDMINVGTDMFATFLAVTRNAYRASYGWGFTYDRNLYNQPVITQSQ